jgi:hypothetical protein
MGEITDTEWDGTSTEKKRAIQIVKIDQMIVRQSALVKHHEQTAHSMRVKLGALEEVRAALVADDPGPDYETQ